MMIDFQSPIIDAITFPEWTHNSIPERPQDVIPSAIIGGTMGSTQTILGEVAPDQD